MKIEVVAVGTELVLGLTIDTNSAELGRALAAAGLEVVRHAAVADRAEPIRAAVAEALDRSGAVIVTGGLGPTRDDITKQVVAELFAQPLVLDPAVLQSLEARFRRFGRAMPALNRSQAEVPAGATVLPNPRGTAPGLWLEDGARLAVLLPGVPGEMRGLLHEEVLPRLASRVAAAGAGPAAVIRSCTVRTTGVPESTLAERLTGIEERVAPLTVAYLPSAAGVDVRVTAWGLAPAAAAERLAAAVEAIRAVAGPDAYGEDDADLAAAVLEQLRQRGAALAVAESCTGGEIAQRLTAVPGASDVFVGGVVAYDNRIKIDLLDVPRALLDTHGAVSEECVRAMVEGARRRAGAGAAIAATGIAGPSGGTPDKPVGTVWLAASVGEPASLRAVRRLFPGDRGEIRARAAQAALDLMRRLAADR